MYTPSGPSPGAQVVQVGAAGGAAAVNPGAARSDEPRSPKKRKGRLSLSAMISSSSENNVPNLTVPLQTPQALLDMDAAEAAPTLPVTGISDEQIRVFRGGAAGADKASDVSKMSLRGKGGGDKDFIDATTPMESPVDLLNAAYERGVGRDRVPLSKTNSTVEQPGLEAEIIQRATANAAPSLSALADLPDALRYGGAESGDEALTTDIQRPTPAPALRVMPKRQAMRQGPDEDKIPTRSLEGLADREIKSYAKELYPDADPLSLGSADPQPLSPADGVPSLDSVSSPSWGATAPSFDESLPTAASAARGASNEPRMTGAFMPERHHEEDAFSLGDVSAPSAQGPGGDFSGSALGSPGGEPSFGRGPSSVSPDASRAEPSLGRRSRAGEPGVGSEPSPSEQQRWSMSGAGGAAGAASREPAPAPVSGPSLSSGRPSMGHTSGPATGFGPGVGSSPEQNPQWVQGAAQSRGPGPGIGSLEVSQGSDGLGKDSFSDERPQTHSKQGRRGLGVAIVVGAGIFCVVLTVVALLAYYAITQHEPASEPVANENVEAGDASPDEEKSRAERFGFVPVDSGAPFEVEGVRFKLKGHKGDKATIVVEGTLFNRGKNAVDAAVLKATVGVVTEEGQTLSHALKEASFKPRVTRRRTWQPGQSVSFELQADGIPRGDLTEAAVDRFMWLTLEAKNGKSFEYKGTLVEVDIE